jgi:polyhydroxybutyrate depolymerase
MTRLIAAFVALGLLLGAARAQDGPALPSSGTASLSLRVGTDERTFVAHVPPTASDRLAPLVLVLHGAGGSGENALEQGHWIDAADRHGFIVLAPEGSLEFPDRRASLIRNPRTWNSGPGTGSWASVAGVDDIGFLRALIDLWIAQGRADPHRVYVTGFSNGSAMTFRAGAELSDQVAAIAPVANGLLVPVQRLQSPVSLLLIWGEDDPLNPIAGGPVERRGLTVLRPSAQASFDRWSVLLGCTASQPEEVQPDVRLLRKTGCAAGSEALFYTIRGLGHQWPGGKTYVRLVSGPGSDALDATEVIWAFFDQHRRP